MHHTAKLPVVNKLGRNKTKESEIANTKLIAHKQIQINSKRYILLIENAKNDKNRNKTKKNYQLITSFERLKFVMLFCKVECKYVDSKNYSITE